MRAKHYITHIVRHFVSIMLLVMVGLIWAPIISCRQGSDDSGKKFKSSILHKTSTVPIVNMNTSGQDTKYILDTGSEMTIINRKFYQNNSRIFNVTKKMLFNASTVNGVLTDSAYMATVLIDSVMTNVVIMDIEDLVRNTYTSTGQIVMGIVGSDFLYSNSAVLDFGNKTFQIKDKSCK